MSSATITEIGPSNFNVENCAKVMTDVAFCEVLDGISDPSFSIEERGHDDAPPVDK